ATGRWWAWCRARASLACGWQTGCRTSPPAWATPTVWCWGQKLSTAAARASVPPASSDLTGELAQGSSSGTRTLLEVSEPAGRTMRVRVASGLGALVAGMLGLLLALPAPPEARSAADRPAVVFEDYPVIPPRGYVCYRAGSPITVDGRLDDAAWEAAPWSEDYVDMEGDKKPRPRYRTRMKMLWDNACLYIAAELQEPHVWGTLTQHDSVIFHDNDFEVFLDPDGDSHLYAELELNTLNTTWDLLLTKPYKDGGKAIDAWEIQGLRTAVHVDGTLNDPRDTDRGWSVEIRWPWRGGEGRRRPGRGTATSGGSTSRGWSGTSRSRAAGTARCRAGRSTTGSGRRRA